MVLAHDKQYSARSEHFHAQDYNPATGLKWDRLDACIAACSIVNDLRAEELYMTKATAKRFSLVPRNPWEEQHKPTGEMTAEKEAAAGGLIRGVSSSSETVARGISSASVGSDSRSDSGRSDSGRSDSGGPVSFRVWQDKVRINFGATFDSLRHF